MEDGFWAGVNDRFEAFDAPIDRPDSQMYVPRSLGKPLKYECSSLARDPSVLHIAPARRRHLS